MRLFTRNGHDCTVRYALIVEATLRSRSASLVIDVEALLLGVDGVSDFDGLHSRKYDDHVMLFAWRLWEFRDQCAGPRTNQAALVNRKAQSNILTSKSSAPRQPAKWPQKRRWDGHSSWRLP
jgi:hypothetical protein